MAGRNTPKEKKGQGLKPNPSSWFGNAEKWNARNFIPGWTLDDLFNEDDKIDTRNILTFDADRPQSLPLYINNNGTQNNDGTQDIDSTQNSANVLFLSVDGADTSLKFNKEVYVVKEAWDETVDDLSGLIDFDFISRANLDLLKSKMYLTGSDARSASEVPQLTANGQFTEAIVIIEDAGESNPPVSTPAPVQLGDGDNDFFGSDDVDIVYAGGGNDNVFGAGNDDVLRGQVGDDTLWGEAGADLLVGEAGRDVLSGEEGLDVLYGGTGDDVLNGGEGTDFLLGMMGNDILNGGEERDAIFGGANNDILKGGAGEDNLLGGSGQDLLNGGIGFDRLSGDGGNDLLVGGADIDHLNGYGTLVNNQSQFDTLVGGAGADRFILGGSWGVSYVETGDGYAVIHDWKAVEDKIEFSGSANQYSLEFKSVSGIGSNASDTEIYYTNANGARDRIAIVRDTNDVNIARDFVLAQL